MSVVDKRKDKRVESPGAQGTDAPNGCPWESADEPAQGWLEEAVRRMPDLDPPDILLTSVMHSVKTKRLPLWSRLVRWAKSPRSITFTPMRVVPVAAVLIGLGLAFAFQQLKNDPAPSLARRVQVVLALRSPEARSVAVIGSFNDWKPQNCELQRLNGEANWTVTLLLPAGRYEYAFVVDGEKIIPDPGAGLHEDDGFGNQNAVLLVGNGNGHSI